MFLPQTHRLYSNLSNLDTHKTYSEINLSNLAENYRRLCAATKNVRHICVVKSDAYGHGADACVSALVDEGCDFFAVSCIEEAIDVRTACGCNNSIDILILGYTVPTQAELLAKYNIIQALLSYDYAKELDRCAKACGKKIRTHIAVDTGMNRIGFPANSDDEISSSAEDICRLRELTNISAEGMFTHFARADEENETLTEGYTKKQYERYDKLRGELAKRGKTDLLCHVCNSAASVRFPEYSLDAVRFGIMLYGLAPSEHVPFPLLPVMKLKTMITHIHTLLPGDSVSYGGIFSSAEPRLIATLPIGYADGFLRAYSGASVTVHTEKGDFKAPVVGRICMDQCMIDITDLPAKVGDSITIFGNSPDDIQKLAKMANTIGYETLCLISARVPIVYTT